MRRQLLLSLALLAPSAGWADTYDIDSSHATAGFSVRHLMVSNVKGQFSNIKGTVDYDPKNPAATRLDAVIDTKTVDTRDAKRDAHLRTADFLDVEKFPTMTFKSKKVEQAAGGRLRVTGDLTLHGVTREVVLDVDGPTPEIKDPWGSQRRGASATTKINRKDFGLTWNSALEAGGVAVSDEVLITLDLELTKKPAVKASR